MALLNLVSQTVAGSDHSPADHEKSFVDQSEIDERTNPNDEKRRWYRTPFFNLTILGLCNFAAPGIWGAMNSLGAGGAARKELVPPIVLHCLQIIMYQVLNK